MACLDNADAKLQAHYRCVSCTLHKYNDQPSPVALTNIGDNKHLEKNRKNHTLKQVFPFLSSLVNNKN